MMIKGDSASARSVVKKVFNGYASCIGTASISYYCMLLPSHPLGRFLVHTWDDGWDGLRYNMPHCHLPKASVRWVGGRYE